MTAILICIHRKNEKKKVVAKAKKDGQNPEKAKKKVGFCSIEFSKRMLYLYIGISLILVLIVVIGTFLQIDCSSISDLAGKSFYVDGAWGGFYLWKSKNENRAKYAQKFVMKFADTYGIDAAIRLAEVVLKD